MEETKKEEEKKENPIIEFCAYKEDDLLAVIEKFRKKKLEIEIIKREEFFITKTRENSFLEKITYKVKKLRYELKFPEIYKIEGFEFLGGLTAKDGTPTFFSDTETDLFKKVNDDLNFKCYHCNKKIGTRLSKLFFKKTDTGEIVNFGTKCVTNYFGIDILRKLTLATAVFERLNESEFDDEFGGGGRGVYFDHHEKIDFLIRYFEIDKVYLSKAKAEYSNNTSTADLCEWFITPISTYLKPDEYREEKEAKEKYFNRLDTTPEDIDRIKEEIYKFYAEKEVKTDFDYNLKATFETLGTKTGLLAYGVFLYYKTLKEAKEAKLEKFVPEYFPEEEIKDLEVVCHAIRFFDGQYGETKIITLRSKEHSLVWFTTSDKVDFIKEGVKCLIKKAKVTNRKEFKGFKNTNIKCRFNWIEEVK